MTVVHVRATRIALEEAPVSPLAEENIDANNTTSEKLTRDAGVEMEEENAVGPGRPWVYITR